MENEEQLILQLLTELGIKLVFDDNYKIKYVEEKLNTSNLDTDSPKSPSVVDLTKDK